MPFDQNQLPTWNKEGVEPPQSLKDEGWQPSQKPPADYFNWFFNKTFKALQSLFTNAQHKEEKGQPNGYAALDENGKVVNADGSLPGGVTSVNNKTGAVTLSAADVGAVSTDDYVNHPAFAVASGTANTYSVTLNPAPTGYTDGMAISIKINVDSTGPSTLNVNGLGAVPLKKSNGNDVTNLKANGVYTFRYNASTGNFILQGEGGSGNAQPSDVLSGKTFTNDSGEQTGTMPNNGAITITPTTTDQAIPAGYHNGTGIVKGDPDLIPSNIKQGVNIFGVVGTLNPMYTLSRKQTIKGSFSPYVTPQGQTLSWRYNTHTVSFAPKFIVMTFNYTQRTATGNSSHPEVAFWINPEVLGVDGTTVKTSDLSHSANGNGNDAWNDVTQFYTILITNVSGNTFQIGQQSYKTDFTYMQSYFASQSYTVTVYG